MYIIIISCSVFLRMRNVSDKFVEKIKTYILCSIRFFFPESRVLYEINVENYGIAGQATEGNIMRHMCFDCR